eukprot:gene32080-40557_t
MSVGMVEDIPLAEEEEEVQEEGEEEGTNEKIDVVELGRVQEVPETARGVGMAGEGVQQASQLAEDRNAMCRGRVPSAPEHEPDSHAGGKGAKGKGKGGKGGKGKGKNGRGNAAPRVPTLLQKLLQKEVHKERSHLSQAFRFFVNNGFFQDTSSPMVFFDWMKEEEEEEEGGAVDAAVAPSEAAQSDKADDIGAVQIHALLSQLLKFM